MPGPLTSLSGFPLLSALLDRRSRRFGAGLRLNGGPLAFASARPPQPLSVEEEAALAFAANGVNGFALSELPFGAGDVPDAGGGHIMVHFVGRTIASGDAMHLCAVFVVNDGGAWMLRRPQDYPRGTSPTSSGSRGRTGWSSCTSGCGCRSSRERVDVPRRLPFIAPFNKWSANVPGTTYFVPVAELSVLYINVLLSFFDEEWAFFFLDDHNGYQPAGIAQFGRSRGGHLYDDPADGRVGTVTLMESWIREFGATEMGAVAQSLGLMAAALGLGGFPHFAGIRAPGRRRSAFAWRASRSRAPSARAPGARTTSSSRRRSASSGTGRS